MFKTDSANSIADWLSVSHTLVQKIRDELVRAKEIDLPDKVVGKDGRSRTPIIQTKQPATVASCDQPKRETTTTTRQSETVKHVEPVADDVDNDDPDDDHDDDLQELTGDNSAEAYTESQLNIEISMICKSIERNQELVRDLAETYPKHVEHIKSANDSIVSVIRIRFQFD